MHRDGELTSGDPVEWFERALEGVTLVPLAPDIVLVEQALGWAHRDPVDRLVVAAAIARGLRVITVDERIHDSGLVRVP